jgi:hypothetical protein
MPIIPIALRGFLWLVSGLGLGSVFGGDKIENQTVIEQTTTLEKVLWVFVTIAGIGLLVLLGVWAYKTIKNRK